MSNYCKNCYELTEELENHKRWIKDYKQKLEDAEEFANAKITQCGNLIKQLNETFEQLEAYKMEAEEGKEINAELKAENKELKRYKSLFEKARNLWDEARMNNYKFLAEIEDLKDSLKRTICQSECYKHKKAEKLSKTLTEIKEIAEKLKNFYEELGKCEDLTVVRLKQILQKISECEV